VVESVYSAVRTDSLHKVDYVNPLAPELFILILVHPVYKM